MGFSLAAAHGLSFPMACGILVPPSGIEPMTPALESRFLTTGPLGKSLYILLNNFTSFLSFPLKYKHHMYRIPRFIVLHFLTLCRYFIVIINFFLTDWRFVATTHRTNLPVLFPSSIYSFHVSGLRFGDSKSQIKY